MAFEIHYECQRCTACCRWPGIVALTDRDITAIATHLAMSEEEFIRSHTRLRPDRRGLSLLEKDDHSCEFLAGNDCAIQSVKPDQCRRFPNQWNFPAWREQCHAIPILRKTPA